MSQKFKPTGQAVEAYIESLDSKKKQEESRVLVKLFEEVSSFPAKIWYPGIIGFGQYNYQTPAGREGISTLVAFAPRQARFALYLAEGFPERAELLTQLGKHKQGKMCIYVNKLADIRLDILKQMIQASLEYTIQKNNLSL